MANDLEKFTDVEVEKKFKDLVSHDDYQKITPQKTPRAIVLGGLAGSGKSNYIQKLKDVYAIIGDDYRNMHPRFNEIKKEHGDDWVFKTNDFAVAMIKKLSEQAIKDRKNVVIEGTFRTYEAPANTLKQFKEAGYETHAHVVLCHKYIAKASTVNRYYKMQNAGLPGRTVKNEKFEEMLKGLGNTADKIKDSKLAKTLTMSARRDLDQLVMVYKSDDTRKPSEVINKEMSRKLTSKEQNFIKEVKQHHEQHQYLEKQEKTKQNSLPKDKGNDKGLEL